MPPPHHPDMQLVAQEGPYAVSTANLPILQYFPARGRAEPTRLALAYAQQEWFEPPIDPILPLYRAQLDGYPFRQLPRFIDDRNGRVDIVQSMAILRHVGRKFDLYGSDEEERTFIDMVVDGVSDLRAKLRVNYWDRRTSPGAAEAYLSTILAPEAQLLSGPRGPGLACIERLVADAAGGGGSGGGGLEDADGGGSAPNRTGPGDGEGSAGWWLGSASRPTIADVVVFDLTDMHLSAGPELANAVRTRFPALTAHHRRFAALPGVKEYLASANRHIHIFGDDWRQARLREEEEKQRQGEGGEGEKAA